MSLLTPLTLTRRRLLFLAAALPIPFVAGACSDSGETKPAPTGAAPGSQPASTVASASSGGTTAPAATATQQRAQQPALSPTPTCGDDDDDPTLAQTEGPFYTRNTPQRQSLREQGMKGTPLLLTGVVQDTGCKPLAGAVVDFWQCDDAGVYDNSGLRLRGHQLTDGQGRYRLESIVPGLYTGRTRHIHVKVQKAGGRVLTTQLYFPNEPGNARDGIYDKALVIESYRDAGGGKEGRFDFVLDA